MNEEIEQSDQEEEEKLTCPECRKGFQDMRGLTSHARHMHELGKDEVKKILKGDIISKEIHSTWKVIGGVGVFILAVITAGKIK